MNLKLLITNLLYKTGNFLLHIGNVLNRTNTNKTFGKKLLSRLKSNPLNAGLHLQLALIAFKKKDFFLAYAELKTSVFLGTDKSLVQKQKKRIFSRLPDLFSMDHNQFFRFITLKNELEQQINRYNIKSPSVLDVGGGRGQLAAFLPSMDYCLAEPEVNGISGLNLPFPDQSFDFVVSCHVLEHISVHKRRFFLDQLLAKAKKGIILLNPIYHKDVLPEKRFKLFIEITNAIWAKEHLKCSLPEIDYIIQYAKSRKLEYSFTPNGTLFTSIAFVFIDFFASKTPNKKEHIKINKFFNQNYINFLTSDTYPNAGLFYLGKHA